MSSNKAIQLRNPASIFFGKIPSRGDFVKSQSGAKVIALIDNWVAQGMEMLLAEPGWKTYYDGAGAIDFLFLGMQNRFAIWGNMLPSSDASLRRFPFIAATLFEIDDALSFLPISPAVLEKHGNQQRSLIQCAAKAADASDVLALLNDMQLEDNLKIPASIDDYQQFLASTSIRNLSRALNIKEGAASIRHMVLAIGYLLQPILTNYSHPPQKGLAIPLPQQSNNIAHIKTFWLDLVSTFLGRSAFEFGIFSCVHFDEPKLIITFNGAPPNAFKALFDMTAAQEYLIDVGQSSWVEEYAMQDMATLKLSSYLNHDDLMLLQLVKAFREGFSGK